MSAASGSRSLAPERRLFAEPFPLLLRCFTFPDQKIVNRFPEPGVRNIMCLPDRPGRIAARKLVHALGARLTSLQSQRDGKLNGLVIPDFEMKSYERRVGQEGVSTCRNRVAADT